LSAILKSDETIAEKPSSRLPSHASFGLELHHDQKLHLVRRLDWRFLLPNPNLKRVGYIGGSDPQLVAALNHFADDVAMLNFAAPAQQPFDLIVARAQRIEIEFVFDWLKAGGCLYWEILPKNFLSPPRIEKIAGELKRVGFVEIDAHWHRPNFDGALDIIPLNQTAFSYFFAPDRGDRRKSAAGRFLQSTGLLKFVMTCVSIVATKSSD
jgi:hypothetical protein